MFHPLTSRLILPAVLIAALVLAGCGGGGDNSGLENTLRADLETLKGDFDDLQKPSSKRHRRNSTRPKKPRRPLSLKQYKPKPRETSP